MMTIWRWRQEQRPAASCRGRLWLCLALALGLPAPAHAQSLVGTIERALFGVDAAVTYDVTVEGLPDALSPDLFEGALRLYRFQKDGVASLALLQRRAESDLETVEKILRSEGYYEGRASVRVAWDPASEEGDAPRAAEVFLTLAPGRPFILAEQVFVSAGPAAGPLSPDAAKALDAQALGAPVGARAEARAILAAENAAVERLRATGRPYATLARREATADFDSATLTVRSLLAPGPRAVFGPLRIEGVEDVETDHLLTYQPWEEGAPFDDAKRAAYQRALTGTGLFSAVTVAKPEAPPGETRPGDPPLALPVTVTSEPAPRRSIGLGGRFSTSNGPEGRISFEHRNLFGANEQLRAALEGGIEDQELAIELRKPQFRRAGQELVAAISLRQEEDDAFNEKGATAGLGLERALGEAFGGAARGGLGVLLEASRIEDAVGSTGQVEPEEDAFLVGPPGFLSLDARDDRLDPSTGFQLKATVTPFIGVFAEEDTEFLTLGLEGAAYHALDGRNRFILAGRGRLGSILSEDLASVPGSRRLYSGGGGSVRGYADRFIGALDSDGDPVGGLSVTEIGAELRVKASETLGGVLFVEAGSVSESSIGFFDEEVQVGVGPGVRYYSPIGPVGVDLGLPIDPREEDDPFQLYFSIGQSF